MRRKDAERHTPTRVTPNTVFCERSRAPGGTRFKTGRGWGEDHAAKREVMVVTWEQDGGVPMGRSPGRGGVVGS